MKRASSGARSRGSLTAASLAWATRTTSGRWAIRDRAVPVRRSWSTSGARSGDLSLEEFLRISEAGQLLEIWNLVFMQYDQQPDGRRSVLPAPSVDTGAGLERISAVMQDVASNFDTDLFQSIISQAVEVVGRPYDRGPAGAPYRVLADHARAVTFLLADGVYPSNEGRGYVLRR